MRESSRKTHALDRFNRICPFGQLEDISSSYDGSVISIHEHNEKQTISQPVLDLRQQTQRCFYNTSTDFSLFGEHPNSPTPRNRMVVERYPQPVRVNHANSSSRSRQSVGSSLLRLPYFYLLPLVPPSSFVIQESGGFYCNIGNPLQLFSVFRRPSRLPFRIALWCGGALKVSSN